MIKVDNLVKKFGSFIAVNNISFEIKKGEIFGLLGANGAGKTTTIRMLCGLLSPSSGKIVINGNDVTKNSEKIKELIGYMSQKFALYSDLTIYENLIFYGGIYNLPKKQINERIDYLLSWLGIREYKDFFINQLPQGIRQKVALSVAIIHNPYVIFLDEPTSGVDPITRRLFWDIIYQLKEEGKTILVTTHFMDEAEFCNNLVLIKSGKIIAMGSPEQIKKIKNNGRMYLIKVDKVFDILHLLKEKLPDSDVFLKGKSLHIAYDLPLDDMKNFLKELGINFYFIKEMKPTLEDIFLSLSKGEKSF